MDKQADKQTDGQFALVTLRAWVEVPVDADEAAIRQAAVGRFRRLVAADGVEHEDDDTLCERIDIHETSL
jgi:stress response protein YsnF